MLNLKIMNDDFFCFRDPEKIFLGMKSETVHIRLFVVTDANS